MIGESTAQPLSWRTSLPSGWKLLPLRRLMKGIEQGWSPVAEERVASIDEWGVIKLSAVAGGAFLPEEHKALSVGTTPESRFEIRAGDILLTRANTPELVGDACLVRATRPRLMLSDLVYRLRIDTTKLDPSFLVYWLQSTPGRAQIRADARGSSQSMVKISQGHIASWVVPLPCLSIQRAIAATLERRTAIIDELIRKKARLIELLQEKRRALIAQAVIKGIDSNSPMKEFGGTWLEKNPAHWIPTRVKFEVELVTSGSRGWSEYFADEGAIFLQSGNLDGELGVDLGQVQRVALPNRTEGVRTKVRLGDVLVCITGALTGNVGLVREDLGDAYVNQHLCLLRPSLRRIEPRFLAYMLASQGAQGQFDVQKYGLKEGLGLDDVKNIRFAAPPFDEQSRICDWLDMQMGLIRALRTKIVKQAELLWEYRQALISAAVTGQLDLRSEEAA